MGSLARAQRFLHSRALGLSDRQDPFQFLAEFHDHCDMERRVHSDLTMPALVSGAHVLDQLIMYRLKIGP